MVNHMINKTRINKMKNTKEIKENKTEEPKMTMGSLHRAWTKRTQAKMKEKSNKKKEKNMKANTEEYNNMKSGVYEILGNDVPAYQTDLLKAMAKKFGVSETSCRRYLKDLHENKDLTKTTEGRKISWSVIKVLKTVKETNHPLDEETKKATDSKPVKKSGRKKPAKKAKKAKKQVKKTAAVKKDYGKSYDK